MSERKRARTKHASAAAPAAADLTEAQLAERKRADAIIVKIGNKKIESTNYLDFGFLEEIGVASEFYRLTERVGFGREFWEIAKGKCAIPELVIEFLASLQVVTFSRSQQSGIIFSMQGKRRKMTMQQLRDIFYLNGPGREAQTEYLGYRPEREAHDDHFTEDGLARDRRAFWSQISDVPLSLDKPEARLGGIMHPVLRYISRAMGNSIFARGENQLRMRHDELQLLSTMLRTNEHLEIPDLACIMAHYWMSIPSATTKDKGTINMGSFVSHIAAALDVDLDLPVGHEFHYGKREAPGKAMTKANARSWKWITYTGGSPVSWLAGGYSYRLPLQGVPIIFRAPCTWSLPPPVPPLQAPPQPTQDIPMQETQPTFQTGPDDFVPPQDTAGTSYHAGEGSSSYAAPWSIPQTEWQSHQELIRQMHATQISMQEQSRADRVHYDALFATQSSRMDDIYGRQDDILRRQQELQDSIWRLLPPPPPEGGD